MKINYHKSEVLVLEADPGGQQSADPGSTEVCIHRLELLFTV